ncbi:related to rRNA-processing protein UTP23 [Phialocephala subalpina]|uniref:U three protein 23 n=1 Tax=Phialocephala subalpina TaxID=576137 RepID=A0A1L7WDP9_9HELO|nr:related to rRNA-processing protein UTP23 [Phialocephala subalpina]
MRGKRAKQYRKLMQQYGLSFGFREPYQVLLDSNIIRDADRFKMDLVGGLERTLHGQVKPMVTQCSMRHLYNAKDEPGVSYLIDKAKTYERRRCGHHPEDFPEPLSEKECMSSVVDPKGSKHNKNRYVVASQDLDVRKSMRTVLGVPLVYINRSVMIMEPMASSTADNREKEERGKFRAGLKRGSGSLKRKREDEDEDGDHKENITEDVPKKKKKVKGPKGPNPLSVKKPKKKVEEDVATSSTTKLKKESKDHTESLPSLGQADGSDQTAKRKRKRKHKSGGDGQGAAAKSEVGDDDDDDDD